MHKPAQGLVLEGEGGRPEGEEPHADFERKEYLWAERVGELLAGCVYTLVAVFEDL